MEKITVIIHTRNEEKNIKECIISAKKLAGNILMIDMESTDNTIDYAKREEIQVISFPYSSYVEPAREFGIKKAKTEWIFILDPDERITMELANEIKLIIQSPTATHYKVPRRNIFGKIKWLKHGGWWPDYQTRLINKHFFQSWPKDIHSTPQINGQTGFLNNYLIHYFHGDIESMLDKTIIFEDIESDLLLKAGKKAQTSTFFRKFLGELYRRLIRRVGFLDGEIGIIESLYQAFSKTITYLYLYEKQVRLVKKKFKSRSLRSFS